MPSTKADSVCFTSHIPALTRCVQERHRCRGLAVVLAPHRLEDEFCNSFSNRRLGDGLLLLVLLFCRCFLGGDGPGRNDSVLPGVCDGLAEMLMIVGDQDVDDIAGIRLRTKFR